MTRTTTWRRSSAVALATALGAQTAHAAPLDERSLIRIVCESSPDAAVARALEGRGQADVDASRVFGNPVLTFEHDHMVAPVDVSQSLIGLGIGVDLGGRHFLLEDAADARLEGARLGGATVLVEAALDLRGWLVRLAADEARLAIGRDAGTRLEAVQVTIDSLATGGEAAAYDARRLGLATKQHARRLSLVKARISEARGQIRAAVGAVELAPLELDALAQGMEADAGAPSPPMLGRIDALVRANELEAEAARRRWVPELGLFLGYRFGLGENVDVSHGLTFRVSIPLTFFDHGQGEAARIDADTSILRAERQRLVERMEAVWASAGDTLGALDGAASADDSTAEADALEADALKLYGAGEGSIVDVLDAYRASEDARLARVDLDEKRAEARLEKMRLRGSLFDADLDRACGRTP